MGQVLYRKYRSRSLDEIIGQEHITTTLKNALKSGQVSHAYLFTGPHGVGKTSIARILAHELNQLDYNGEDTHLDIIEIDAASNRGIDEIRDLREKVNVAPTSGKYKVYIIDEVHMLTTPAFNALLKTLEEPPAHVIFILATTEAHKLPETIVSRTQRYAFRPVEQAKVISHLRHIASKEKIKVDDDALALIAAHGEGSFRDSISLMDQAASRGGAINTETIRDVLGIPPQQALQQLLQLVVGGDKAALITQLNDLYGQGYQAGTIAKQLAVLGRSALLNDTPLGLGDDALLALLTSLIDVPASAAPERLLEIVLLQAAPQSVASSAPPLDTASQKATVRAVEAPSSVPEPKPVNDTAVTPAKKAATKGTEAAAKSIVGQLDQLWPTVLDQLKSQHNTLYGILRMAHPALDGDQLTLTFKYAFHQKRMAESRHRQVVAQTIEQLTGRQLQIECLCDQNLVEDNPLGARDAGTPAVQPSASPESSPLVTISNIFGGGELLES